MSGYKEPLIDRLATVFFGSVLIAWGAAIFTTCLAVIVYFGRAIYIVLTGGDPG